MYYIHFLEEKRSLQARENARRAHRAGTLTSGLKPSRSTRLALT